VHCGQCVAVPNNYILERFWRPRQSCSNAIITLVLAIIIWRTWPANAGWVLGILVGFSMLFSGVSRLMLALAARRLASELA
jgi:hypothetical protein